MKDTSAPATTVCVTGAAGFVGSWLVMRLLERGYIVRATVRDPANMKKVKHLLDLPKADTNLTLWKADLTEEGSFDEAIEGCSGVFHVATPMDFESKDPENEVIKPTINGVLSIVRSCTKAKTVKRLMFTSSAGTVCVQEHHQPIYDESNWSDLDFIYKVKMTGWMYFVSTKTVKILLSPGTNCAVEESKMARERGKLVYMAYRILSYGLSPLLYLHVRWRKLRGLEHPLRWPERLGRPSLPRPPGPLLWFHAVSLGEGMAAIPVIKCCVERRPDINILMTTTTLSAFEVIKNQLPSGVIYQFAPLDMPVVMDTFLGHWRPNAIMLMESELWPNLIMGASKNGIVLALLNARMSVKSFNNWSGPLVLPLTSLMLSKFSLIAPLSTMQAIRFQLLQASPFIINFCGDLKYATEAFDLSDRDKQSIEDLRVQLAPRRVWIASSIHRGEEEVMLGVHKVLKQVHPDVVTIVVPRHPQHGKEIALELQKEGVSVALRSRDDRLMQGTNIYVVDTLGELRDFYRLTPIAVIGGSFLPDLTGHNISEAAAAGCAVLTGHHVGHFAHMVQEMQRLNPLSVLQVSGKLELEKALSELLSNATVLEARRAAARQAFHALSIEVIEKVWNILNFHIFREAELEVKADGYRTKCKGEACLLPSA